MKRPAVFFDRDNTLITCDDYLGDASKVCLVDGAADAVARARQLGYATVIFSNQSGVGRGYFTEEAVHQVNARLDEMLRERNPKAIIDRHEFCPFHPEATVEKYRQDSPMRKPAPGMLHSAAEALGLDLQKSWVIGDAPRDIEAGHAAGCRTILFNDPSVKASPAAEAEQKVAPDFRCSSLKEAIDIIARHTTPTASAPPDKPPKVESLLGEILQEIRRHREQPTHDFSVSKLMAGIVQVLALAILFIAFLNRADDRTLNSLLLFALTLQTMTIAMLIMGRQK